MKGSSTYMDLWLLTERTESAGAKILKDAKANKMWQGGIEKYVTGLVRIIKYKKSPR